MKHTGNMDKIAFLLLASLYVINKMKFKMFMHVLLALQGWFVCLVVSFQM